MLEEYDKIEEATAFLRERADAPKVALVLGSGLGAYADSMEDAVEIPYSDIPNFPASTVSGHSGQLVVGTVHGLPVAAMQGRIHAYEGVASAMIVRPIRTLIRWGAGTALITNAAGAVNPSLTPGTLMLIEDHLNLSGKNPLVGPNDDRLGVRFPDMSSAYDPALRADARDVAESQEIELASGVYASVLGPTYETPAEVRMFRGLGADAVGMSTVPEVIAARHMGCRVLGISCITNLGAGLGDETLDHEEVKEVAARVRAKFRSLVDGVLARWAADPEFETGR